jgi:hypothetical protein
MTGGAFNQFLRRYTLLKMFFRHILRLVLVAGIAGVFRVYIHVTGLAGQIPPLAMIKGEGVLKQQRRRPGLGGMTALALRPEKSGMNIRFCMAVNAQARRIAKAKIRMTSRALKPAVLPIQGEDGSMIKTCHAVCTIVALQAIRAYRL